MDIAAAGTVAPAKRRRSHRRAGRARPRVLLAIGLTAAVLLAFWCFLRVSQTTAPNSDAAGQVLQGWDMLHGNPLLRGWILSDVSFYTFEVPLDGLDATVFGYGPDVVNITAALIYTLLVLVAALLAKGRARGGEGAVRALLAAGVLIAPVLTPDTHLLLEAPDHTGIAFPVMVALLLVDLAPERWWAPVTACVLLTWAQVDDSVATYACALPLAAVCLARAAAVVSGRLVRRRPAPNRALPWYDAALAVAAVSSFGLARLALSAIHAAGGFYVHPVHDVGLAPATAVPGQLLGTVKGVISLFSANYFSQPDPVQAAIGYLHLAGLAVALCGLAIAVWGLFFRLSAVFMPGPSGRADRVTQAMTIGVAVMLAAFAFGSPKAPVHTAHEIAIVLPLCAVLGGRLLGPWLSGASRAPGSRRDKAAGSSGTATATSRRPRTVADAARVPVAVTLAVAGAGYLGTLGYTAWQRPGLPQTPGLAGFLAAHRLTSGLANYWVSNVTTLTADGHVRVAPVYQGGTTAYPWESNATWYDPAVSSANFVITATFPPRQLLNPRLQVVRSFYGKPARTYHFEQFTISIYDYNLLRRVRQPVP